MADVRARRGADDRAQMLLVAAFGLAVMLVGLALILNTAIYTENIATRSSDIIGGKDAAQLRAAVEEGSAGLITYANYHNNSSDADLYEAVSNGTEDWSSLTGSHEVLGGRSANVSLVRQSNGTRIYQRVDRNFSDDDLNDDWTLVAGADGVRNYSITVLAADLENVSLGSISGTFYVNISESSGADWRDVHIYGDSASSNIVVEVEDPSGSTSRCTAAPGADGTVNVSVTDATVDGDDCGALRFLGSLDGTLDVSYNDALDTLSNPNIKGQYEFVANASSVTASHYDDPVAPHSTPAVYSVTVDVTYEGQRLFYRSHVRAAPGEQDG